MNIDAMRNYQQAANNGSMPDEDNPIFLFAITRTALLVKLINGEVDAVDLARYELRNRGMNEEGKWVGFRSAE